jgi:hypothetical protein
MRTALRCDQSALGLSLLLVALLLSPVALSWIGPPSRIEAYKSISTEAGTVGTVIQAIYKSPPEGDVVLLGSSLVSAGISQPVVQAALSQHLHRPASVQVLAMNWPGLDVQYFMLRDYLNTHRARLVVWNLPEPHARAYDYPHIQAYRWLRYGEYADALDGLPFQYRMALYGETIIGAPRLLLSILRPNLVRNEGTAIDPALDRTGYLGAKFVPDDSSPSSAANYAQLLPLDSPSIAVRGPVLGAYQMHFARLIVTLAKQHHCRVVLLHLPIGAEYNDSAVPELSDWKAQLDANYSMIAVSSAGLFDGMDRSRFEHFFRDTHLNENGRRYFTQAILPALQQAFDESAPNQE